MNTPNDGKLPPLKDIATSGSYILKLIRPKDDRLAERFKWSRPDENGKSFATCRLFFLDGDGNCLTQNFSVKHYTDANGVKKAPMSLAMVVGKFSGKYAQAPSEEMSVEQLFKFVEPAFGKKATVEVEVTPNGEWNGRPQYRYRFKKITALPADIYGAQPSGEPPYPSPGPNDLPPPEAIPF